MLTVTEVNNYFLYTSPCPDFLRTSPCPDFLRTSSYKEIIIMLSFSVMLSSQIVLV